MRALLIVALAGCGRAVLAAVRRQPARLGRRAHDVLRRQAKTDRFGLAVLVGGVSDPAKEESQHWVSADDLTIYFTSPIPEGGGILVATRETPDAAFGPAIEVPGINTMFAEYDRHEDLYIATR